MTRTTNAKVPLDLNDIALLVRVVQTHSFSAAARERGVPVSTVSRRIARLESSIGVRLLERTTRRLHLTDAGRTYFEHAERAVDDLAQGNDRVHELQKEPRGLVRIIAPDLGTAVSDEVWAYLAKYRHVSVDLQLVDRPIDSLSDDFDIALVTGNIGDTSDFVARALWRSTRKLLYASPRYVKEHGAPRRIEDLARHACVATRAIEGPASWTLVRGRQRRRVAFVPRVSVNRHGVAHEAVLADVGIAILPQVLCAEDVARKRLVRVLKDYEGEAGGVHLLYRAQRSLTAAVRTCVAHFLAELPATDPAEGSPRSARKRVKSGSPQ
jgi:DNA-binding transcriptional LysR family regulator